VFGSCVLNKALALILLFLLAMPTTVWAQAQQATVINEGSLVYQDADFDAPVIETLGAGRVFSISTTKKGPFFKIRLQRGRVGWIADSDVKPGVIKVETPEEKKEAAQAAVAPPKKVKPFFATRYRGPVLEYLHYVEDTLGKERDADMIFYGLKFNGYNTIFDGEIYTDANILLHFGAPDFYSEATGKNSDGLIIIGNFLLQTTYPQGKSRIFFYGFGPMLKYTHYDLEVPDGVESTTYKADDLNLGAVFNLGYSFRVWDMSLHMDAKYYWEETSYYGLGLNLGWEY
jgi:hypothetical protein